MGPEHFEQSDNKTEIQEIGQKFNEAANELMEVMAKAARSSHENEPSLAETNVDFALGLIAHSLKGGGDIEELLKQLIQTSIVNGNHIPEADVLVSEISEIARDYQQLIRGSREY